MRRGAAYTSTAAFVVIVVITAGALGYVSLSTSQTVSATTTITSTTTSTTTAASSTAATITSTSTTATTITSTTTTTTSSPTTSTNGPSAVSLPQPPYVTCGPVPGISEVIVNGTTKCVVGPPIVVNNDGVVDFRNGTGVDLYANLTGSSFIGGTAYDTVVTLQATRFTFNAHGLIATIYPYQGKEIFANGTFTTFPACVYPISTTTQYPRGSSGNGTVWFPAAGGETVWFYPDGTCSETNG